MLPLSFSRIYLAFFIKALFTLITSLGRSLAVLDHLEATEQPKAAVSGKGDSVPPSYCHNRQSQSTSDLPTYP